MWVGQPVPFQAVLCLSGLPATSKYPSVPVDPACVADPACSALAPPRVACIFEDDFGHADWRHTHTTSTQSHMDGVRSTALVVRCCCNSDGHSGLRPGCSKV